MTEIVTADIRQLSAVDRYKKQWRLTHSNNDVPWFSPEGSRTHSARFCELCLGLS